MFHVMIVVTLSVVVGVEDFQLINFTKVVVVWSAQNNVLYDHAFFVSGKNACILHH